MNTKELLLEQYGVINSEQFDPEMAAQVRVAYLKQHLKATGRKSYVLGISGGVDSTTAGRLAQIAVNQLNNEGYPCAFYAVRLPAGVQNDEADAQQALAFIQPSHTMTVNIGPSADALQEQMVGVFGDTLTAQELDFHKGNAKARIRMAAQYYIAAATGGLVIGTDHNSECVTGFFTKYGDSACDLTVLDGMNKRQVRLLAEYLGAPEALYKKAPTADLEELNPGKLDDEGFGFPYDMLDDFLEGKDIPADVEKLIIERYEATAFKRESAIPSYTMNGVWYLKGDDIKK